MLKSDENKYLSKPKLLPQYLEKVSYASFFHKEKVGNMEAYCLGRKPIFVRQFNSNFKTKYFLGTMPLLSIKRPSLKDGIVQKDLSERQTRIYLSLGSLPFFDNHSGIPRVAKELCKAGIARTDVSVVPIYPDPLTGRYRIAASWLRARNLVPSFLEWSKISSLDDPEITVKKGDWLIHTMVNNNELVFMRSLLEDFRRQGGKVGFVLHDLIPEDFPEFYRTRDVKLFRHWLLEITRYDAIFAISNATKKAYLRWSSEKKLKEFPRIDYFHLGADFKKNESLAESLPEGLPRKVPFFLQVSTIEPRKGYDRVLDAFDHLWKDGFQGCCVFVGRKGWKVKSLVRRIERHPELGKKLFWFQRVSDGELVALYKQSQAVIVPSIVEGFGLSVIEAMYYKKKIILRDIPVFREIAEDNAYYFNENTEPLEDLIKLILSKKLSTTEKNYKFLSWRESFNNLLGIIRHEN